jgi:acyl phosphate:glycerol-3-phosphate acyltransferase
MQILYYAILLILSYLIGSIPFGLLIVKLVSGKDIRKVESGRTGGTNAMRAAGWGAGFLTAIMDLLKGAAVVWLARMLFPLQLNPANAWIHIMAPLATILGHNYSIYLVTRDNMGRLHFRGGAGGAPSTGGALGLWAPSIFIIIPVATALLFGVGYASLATLSIGLLATIIFAYRAWIGLSPWQYILYGVITLALLAYSLRPNIKRLITGNERLVGWRARRKLQAPPQP